MRTMKSLVFAFACLVTSTACAEIDSGPKVGTVVSPLKVFASTGEHAGKELDIAAERGSKPTIYIFVPHERFDRPLARLLRSLEKSAIETGNDVSLVTVFLTANEDKTKEHLPKIQMSLQFTVNPMVIFPSATMSPEGWAVNTDAQLTVLVVNEKKVSATFGYRSANDTVAPEIIQALKKAVGK